MDPDLDQNPQPNPPTDQISSLNPDVDLSGPIPHVTIRPRPTAPTPVEYNPFQQQQPAGAKTYAPSPVDYDPFAATPSNVARTIGERAAPATEAISKAIPVAQQKVAQMRGAAPDVDYTSGAPFPVRVMLQRAENPNEAQKVLEHYYGPGNYGQDERGQWWVNQDNKKVAVMPSGFLQGLENIGAGMTASASPMAGAIAGGTWGAGVGGPFGAALGAGMGAAGGWAADQLVKYYQNLYDQSPAETVKHAANEAAMNMALTGAMPALRTVGRAITEPLRGFLGVTPTTKAMTSQLVEEGARPPIASAAPDFRSWADKQVLRNLVAGDPWEETNANYIRSRFEQALKSSGLPDAEISGVMSEAANPLSAPSLTQTGEALAASAQRKLGAFQAEALTAKNEAQAQLNDMERSLRQWSQQPVGRLGADVANAIVGKRQQFGQMANRVYSSIDNLTGNAKVFPLDAAFQEAQRLVNLAEPGLVPPYIRQFADRGAAVQRAKDAIARLEREGGEISPELRAAAADGDVTFAEAHELRSNLREILGHNIDLTRTPYMGKIADIEDAIDGTFASLESSQGLPAQAAARLKEMDKIYRKGISLFKDTQINQLVRSVRSGMTPDPEIVASAIIRDGRTEAAKNILGMIPQEVKENVAKADMRNIIQDASRRDVDGNLALDGFALLDQIEKRGPMMSELYGSQASNQLKVMAKNLAALGGKMDVSNLPPSQVSNAINAYIQRTRQIDEFIKGNSIGALASGKPEIIDRAARQIAMPGREATTAQARNFFGANSPEWQMVQKSALQNLVRSALLETPSRNITVSGEAIENALKRYTAAQQEMLFPGGLADDLREVAKQARFLFPPRFGGGDMAQSMAAKSITLHTGVNIINPRTAYADMRWIYTSMMGWFTDRPAVLRFLADSSKSNPTATRAMMGVIGRWLVNQEFTGPGKGRPLQ